MPIIINFLLYYDNFFFIFSKNFILILLFDGCDDLFWIEMNLFFNLILNILNIV